MRLKASEGGSVIWITGVSGAGKTTVASLVVTRLRKAGVAVAHLDGDQIRRTLPIQGYSQEDRLAIAHHYSGLAKLLSAQGLTVVVSTISLFSSVHQTNRKEIERYLEVLLSVPLDVLIERDNRGIYSKDQPHPVVALDLAADFPGDDDVVLIENHGSTTPREAADAILEVFLRRTHDWDAQSAEPG